MKQRIRKLLSSSATAEEHWSDISLDPPNDSYDISDGDESLDTPLVEEEVTDTTQQQAKEEKRLLKSPKTYCVAPDDLLGDISPADALKHATYCQNPEHQEKIATIIDRLARYRDPYINLIVHIAALMTLDSNKRPMHIFVANGDNVVPITFNKNDNNVVGYSNYPRRQIHLSGEESPMRLEKTLIHEMTHFVLSTVYRNGALPFPREKSTRDYIPTSPEQTRRKAFTALAKDMKSDVKPRIIGTTSSHRKQIYSDVFKNVDKHKKLYPNRDDKLSEYVARISEMYIYAYRHKTARPKVRKATKGFDAYKDSHLMPDLRQFAEEFPNNPFPCLWTQKNTGK